MAIAWSFAIAAIIALGRSQPNSGVLAYTLDTDGIADIFLLDLARNKRVNITLNQPLSAERPVWSPDGTRIAFELNRGSSKQLCVWQFEWRTRCYEPVGVFDSLPMWSPDGQWLLFDTIVGQGGNLFLIRVDTGEVRPLNVVTEQVRRAYSWSPDGTEIAFAQYLDSGAIQLSVMHLATGVVRALVTDPSATDMLVAWSPRSSEIAFLSDANFGYRAYITDAHSGGLRQLTEQPGYDQFINWSPDGNALLLVSNRAGDDLDLFRLNPSNGMLQLLTVNTALDERPSWSPDSQEIAFTSDRDGDVHVYVMNADGSGVRRVTFAQGRNTDPDWQP